MVLRTARRLHAALAGQRLQHCDLRWPSLATADLTGYTVLEVRSVGKHLLTRLDGELALTLHSHLRMDGSWHLHRTGTTFAGRPAEGVRAVLETPPWTAVGHQLGMLDLVRTSQEDTLVGHLGPDLLDPSLDHEVAVHRLTTDPDRQVGEALLDQRVLAGVGTLYMAESLFLTGLTPWSPVGDLASPERLVALLVRMMTQNTDRAVQSMTGDLRPGQQNYVHSRSGRPCRRCRRPVRVADIGQAPQQRPAFYCPGCQRGPAPALSRPRAGRQPHAR